jgi:hypothetical protein
MKSKEEIIGKGNGFFYKEDFVYHKESVLAALDEYAKEFGRFIEREQVNFERFGDIEQLYLDFLKEQGV